MVIQPTGLPEIVNQEFRQGRGAWPLQKTSVEAQEEEILRPPYEPSTTCWTVASG